MVVTLTALLIWGSRKLTRWIVGRRNVGEIIKRGRIYYIPYYDLHGRRRLESTHSDDRNEAEKLLRKRLSAKDGGALPEAAIGSLTLKEATDDLIADDKTNKRKSLRDVQGKITMHLLPFFGERRKMTSIGTPEIRRFIANRQSEERDDDGKITKRAAKPAEINRALAALRRSFNLGIQAGRLINRPHFPMLKERNTRRGFLDGDQIECICAALEATETAANAKQRAGELANVVRFAFVTGWRTISECCRSNGGTSIGTGAVSAWTRIRRRTTKAGCSRSRPTSRRS